MPEKASSNDENTVTAALKDVSLPPPPPPPPPPVDAEVEISVSSDRMRAEAVMAPARNGGMPPDAELIRDALARKGVVAGISEEVIARMAGSPKYDVAYDIAQGIAPLNGTPARLVYKIRTEKDLRPRENPDGSVDYKDLGIIQSVNAGDVLCEKIPATPGVPGVTVMGAPIPAAAGKDVPMPVGRNTALSEDKLSLVAAIAGQVDIVGGKIQVLNTFTVRGDVCNATGNIDFNGNVVVDGSVLTGFAVNASGNIDINGSVEAAVVTAGGNIILREGINGLGKGIVKAGGYIKAKYIQSGIVQAAGDIESTFIINSNVQSGGSIIMRGSKATLVGGRATARKLIDAVFVGGRNSPIATVVEVGNDPSVLARSREIPSEMASATKDIDAIARAISLFEQHEKAGRLTEDKLAALRKARAAHEILSERLLLLEQEKEAVAQALADFGFGRIRVSQTMYAGVRIIIGSEQLLLESNYDRCMFERSEKAGVQMLPYRDR